MTSTQQNQPGEPAAPPRKPAAMRLLDLLASVKFAVTLIVVIAAACVLGTILPQGAETAAYVQKNPGATERLALFGKLGLTHLFSSWWFIALLCVLAGSVMACSVRRLVTVKRTSGFAQRRALGSMFIHVSILLILAGAVARGVWGEKGYLELHEGDTKTQFETANGAKPLPFALQLASFQIETYGHAATDQVPTKDTAQLVVQWPARQVQASLPAAVGTIKDLTPEGETPSPSNTFRIQVLQYVPDFAMDAATRKVMSRSSKPRNPAILVAVSGPDYHNHRWVFANFPDFTMHEDGSLGRPSPLRLIYQSDAGEEHAQMSGRIKNFKSTLNLVAEGKTTGTQNVEVNHPLKYRGYTFYQTGYNPNDPSWTSLEVVRDPGVPLVYGGFALMIAGLFVVFYLNPWLASRKAQA